MLCRKDVANPMCLSYLHAIMLWIEAASADSKTAIPRGVYS
jgi:hypothetical protein